jgi:hypothetical protein
MTNPKKPKTDYPKQCEEHSDKLRLLLALNRIPDLTRFEDDFIWKEEEKDETIQPDGQD